MTQIGQLTQVCEDIFRSTGIRPVIYDADMQLICAMPDGMSAFCAKVRTYKGLSERCLACDRAGFAKCRESGDICMYRCHMGLTEAAAPILDSGVVIGYLLFGQLLSRGEQEEVEARIDASDCISDKEELKALLKEIEVIDEEKLRATAHLMAMCACYIRLNHLLRVQQESLAVHIAQYVEAHLSEPSLSIAQLCKTFGISRSTLYAVSKQAFSAGITSYIRARRIERAITLLRTSELSLQHIADQVGISDADYLSKLVKKTLHESPRQVRARRARV